MTNLINQSYVNKRIYIYAHKDQIIQSISNSNSNILLLLKTVIIPKLQDHSIKEL